MEASDLNDSINIIDGDPVLTNPQPEDFHDFIVDEDVFNYGFYANDYMTHTPPMKKVVVIIMMVLLLLDVYLKIIMLLK